MFGRGHKGPCALGSQDDYPFRWTRIVQPHGEGAHAGESLAELEGWEGLGAWWVPTPEDISQADSASTGAASAGSAAAEEAAGGSSSEGESASSEVDTGSDAEWVDSGSDMSDVRT